jgi:hypothetical protein
VTPSDPAPRTWTIYRVRMHNGAVGQWQVDNDTVGEGGRLFDLERVEVVERSSLERVEAERDRLRAACEGLEAVRFSSNAHEIRAARGS